MAENKSKLENINKRLVELESALEEASAMLETAKGNYKEIVEGVALGLISTKDMKAVDVEMKKLENEVHEITNQIVIVRNFKRKAAIEELPLIREIKKKKFESVQKEYDIQAEAVKKKRDDFLLELAKMSAIKSKIAPINAEARQALEGVEGITELSHNIRESHVIAPINQEFEGLGISENIQRQTASGSIPSWVRK